MRGERGTWTDDQFLAAMARHTNITDALRELGLRPAGGNRRSMTVHAARPGADVNGVYNDNRPGNLRWLCPNCRSRTATLAGRGRRSAMAAARRPTA